MRWYKLKKEELEREFKRLEKQIIVLSIVVFFAFIVGLTALATHTKQVDYYDDLVKIVDLQIVDDELKVLEKNVREDQEWVEEQILMNSNALNLHMEEHVSEEVEIVEVPIFAEEVRGFQANGTYVKKKG